MRNVLLLLCVLLPLAGQARTVEDVTLPESLQVNGTALQLNGYPVEITETGDNVIRTVRIRPPPQGESAGA